MRFHITTPIYYVNDTPHIGHAYTSLACDALARWHRLAGREVRLLTGTDEHGQKVAKAAEARGEEPQAFTDKISGNFRQLVADMNYSPDDFIRTTEARHKQGVAAFWQRLEERGQLYLGTYSGWYAVRDEAYYDEGETEVGEDGVRRAPSGAQVEWLEEPSYFFRLSAWQEKLLALYEQPGFILPETRRNEVASFVRSGLRDLSVSRINLRWGIPVPGDEEHVIYVWLDALLNYLTATGWPGDEAGAEKWWPPELHMVGKDILRFHAVYWPAFLMAAEMPVPKRVFGHGWLLEQGRKMSKSEGNVLRPAELIERYGLDNLRYYLMREVSFGQDGQISHANLLARCNAELANGLGNLAQRSLSMVQKNLGGEAPGGGRPFFGEASGLAERVGARMEAQEIHLALEEIWGAIGEANRAFDEAAPWTLAKEGKGEALAKVLADTLETARCLAYLLHPIMPGSCSALLRQLGDPAGESGEGEGRGAREGEGGLTLASLETPLGARSLAKPSPVFARLEDDKDDKDDKRGA